MSQGFHEGSVSVIMSSYVYHMSVYMVVAKKLHYDSYVAVCIPTLLQCRTPPDSDIIFGCATPRIICGGMHAIRRLPPSSINVDFCQQDSVALSRQTRQHAKL